MSRPQVEPLVPACFGEAPHWCSDRQELYFVDALQPTYVHRYNPQRKEHRKVEIEGNADPVSIVIPVKGQEDEFIISSGRKHPELRKLKWNGVDEKPNDIKTVAVLGVTPGGTLNDGKCDASGRLWIGGVGPNPSGVFLEIEKEQAALFSMEKGFKIRKQYDNGITLGNGITWNLENTIMYHIDSLKYTVDAFDFDLQTGILSNRRTVFDFKTNGIVGLPDGMTTDVHGKLWVALFGGSQVIRIDPISRTVMEQIKFPVSQVTSLSFGGPNLDTLYVTSAKYGDAVCAEKHAGYLFQINGLGTKGIPAAGYVE